MPKSKNHKDLPRVFRPTQEAVDSFWSGVFRRYHEAIKREENRRGRKK